METPQQAVPKQNSLVQTLTEWLVLGISIIERRWLLLIVPVIIASILGVVAVKMSPTTFTAKSLIMLQAANKKANSGSFASLNRQTTIDQIAAIEAWLKSDLVLTSLLPLITEKKALSTSGGLIQQMRNFRRALTMELIGGSALEIRLEDSQAKGLANKLEIVVSRVMEGLTGPEQGILSAEQFVYLRRTEDVDAAEAALNRALEGFKTDNPDKIRNQLKQLYELRRPRTVRTFPEGGAASAVVPEPVAVTPPNVTRQIAELKAAISPDALTVADLENLYTVYENAKAQAGASKERLPSGRRNYVGIFDSPEDLLIVGRPRDPLTGESSVKKTAIAGIILSFIIGTVLALLAELLEGRLTTTRHFETAARVPVIARLRELT